MLELNPDIMELFSSSTNGNKRRNAKGWDTYTLWSWKVGDVSEG